jgi:DNA-binding response OmpR family regulator
MRILLAEDDELLGSGIKAGLTQKGFHVDWVRDGVAAERELLTGEHQAVVLDLGLPRQDGMDSLKAARARRIATPVLVLTARDAVSARIEGLDAGADDYLVKPVDLHELAARAACAGASRPWPDAEPADGGSCDAGPGRASGCGSTVRPWNCRGANMICFRCSCSMPGAS